MEPHDSVNAKAYFGNEKGTHEVCYRLYSGEYNTRGISFHSNRAPSPVVCIVSMCSVDVTLRPLRRSWLSPFPPLNFPAHGNGRKGKVARYYLRHIFLLILARCAVAVVSACFKVLCDDKEFCVSPLFLFHLYGEAVLEDLPFRFSLALSD